MKEFLCKRISVRKRNLKCLQMLHCDKKSYILDVWQSSGYASAVVLNALLGGHWRCCIKKRVLKYSFSTKLFLKSFLFDVLMYPFEERFYFNYLYFFLESVRNFNLNSIAIVSNQKTKIFCRICHGKGMTNTM